MLLNVQACKCQWKHADRTAKQHSGNGCTMKHLTSWSMSLDRYPDNILHTAHVLIPSPTIVTLCMSPACEESSDAGVLQRVFRFVCSPHQNKPPTVPQQLRTLWQGMAFARNQKHVRSTVGPAETGNDRWDILNSGLPYQTFSCYPSYTQTKSMFELN